MSVVRRKSRADRRKRDTAILHRDRRSVAPQELEIKSDIKDADLLVRVKNPLIATNCYTLREAISNALDKASVRRIILNMEHVPYADTTGICLLIKLHRQFLKDKIEFIVYRMCPRVKDIIEILNLNGVLTLRDH